MGFDINAELLSNDGKAAVSWQRRSNSNTISIRKIGSNLEYLACCEYLTKRGWILVNEYYDDHGRSVAEFHKPEEIRHKTNHWYQLTHWKPNKARCGATGDIVTRWHWRRVTCVECLKLREKL